EQRLMVGRPLRHPHQRLAGGVRRDIVEQIAVAEAAPVGPGFGMDLIDCRGDVGDLVSSEHAADDRVTVPPIMRQIGIYVAVTVDPQALRRTHHPSPRPREEYINSLTFP